MNDRSKKRITHRQLRQTERYQIQAIMKVRQAKTEITHVPEHHQLTISLEVACGYVCRGYRSRQAQNLSEWRSQFICIAAQIYKRIFRYGPSTTRSSAIGRLQTICLSLARRFSRRSVQKTRWAIIFSATKNKNVNLMQAVVVDDANSLIGNPLFFDLKRKSDAP